MELVYNGNNEFIFKTTTGFVLKEYGESWSECIDAYHIDDIDDVIPKKSNDSDKIYEVQIESFNDVAEKIWVIREITIPVP